MKLHIGCGSYYMEGWVNIDLNNKCKTDLNIDITKGLPFETESIEAIVTNHFLEHLKPKDAFNFLQDSYRVLQTGGIIRISVPDLEMIIKDYLESKKTGVVVGYWNTHPEEYQNACQMFNAAVDCLRLDGHFYTYDEEDLFLKLNNAGFKKITRTEYGKGSEIFNGCDPNRANCLVIEAIK